MKKELICISFSRGIMKKLMLGCLLLSVSSLANSLSLDAQRSIFSKSLDLQNQEEWQKANKEMDSILNYPLAYITRYNYLNANISKVSDEEILTFLRLNEGKAISNDLLHAYLLHLAANKKWKEFLTASPSMPNNQVLQCHYLQASVDQGQSEKVWPEAKKMWLSETAISRACNGVFSFYENENMLTQEDIWQRFLLAYENNKPTLMRSLIPQLETKKAKLANNLYQLYKNPHNIQKSHLFTSRDADSFPFLIHSINRLAKRDITGAMQVFTTFEKNMDFTPDEVTQVKTQFATTIVQGRKTGLFQWLDNELSAIGNSSLIEQRIRYAIKQENWDDIEYWLKKLPAEEQSSSSWMYWQARVLEQRGELKQALEVYEEVAKSRNYHGFMAAQKLGINFNLNADTITEKHGSLSDLDGELTLIEELLFHNLNRQAKSQWNQLLNRQSPERQQQLGLYAFDKGWAHLSVLASINSKSWDALNIRFPSAKPELFIREAKKYDLEESYIYAITRRESSFDEQAQSPVGASGYMQLMPKTAKETARKIKLKEYKKVEQLNQGNVNVQLGTAYFNSLLKYYDGNRLLATAAYNAGPNRVDKWFSPNKKEGKEGIKMDSWIESIPYYETRAYVQSILVYNVIYQHILDKPLKFLKEKELLENY
jgi:soluble lytic murein transglycosylase